MIGRSYLLVAGVVIGVGVGCKDDKSGGKLFSPERAAELQRLQRGRWRCKVPPVTLRFTPKALVFGRDLRFAARYPAGLGRVTVAVEPGVTSSCTFRFGGGTGAAGSTLTFHCAGSGFGPYVGFSDLVCAAAP